jgi:hypothetical protein
MKALVFIAFLTIASTASLGQNFTSTGSMHYSRSQVKAMAESAKTSTEYRALHDYYSHLAATDQALADEEKQEWERRAANPTVYGKKYPTPVDSAHYLYDYYLQKAKTSEKEAQRYAQLAETAKLSN